MTRDELVALLTQGGIDIDEFNRKGEKSFEQLLQESEREVRLYIEEANGRVVKHSRSAGVVISAEGEWLCQVELQYKSGKILPGNKNLTLTETMRKHELASQAAARCLKEEARIKAEPSDLVFLDGEHHEERDSRVYPGIWSIVSYQIYGIELPRKPKRWGKSPLFRDKGKVVRCEWIPGTWHFTEDPVSAFKRGLMRSFGRVDRDLPQRIAEQVDRMKCLGI